MVNGFVYFSVDLHVAFIEQRMKIRSTGQMWSTPWPNKNASSLFGIMIISESNQ